MPHNKLQLHAGIIILLYTITKESLERNQCNTKHQKIQIKRPVYDCQLPFRQEIPRKNIVEENKTILEYITDL